MKNFDIGKDIIALLSADTDVTSALGTKIFPLIAPAKTTFPFMVYRRYYYTPANNKDWENEKVGVEFAIASVKYEEGVKIADAVADALQHQKTDNIEDINVTNTNEDFYDDTFVQRINIEVEMK